MNILQEKTKAQGSIADTLAYLRSNFNTGKTRPLAYRLQQLNGLERFLKECEHEIEQALFQDLHRATLEAFTGDIGTTLAELNFTRKHLASWIKPKRVPTVLAVQPAKGFIYHEPLGVVLIIAPWNYPINLALVPLIGAIAAGNCAMVKPSEMAPTISALLAKQLPKYIDSECIQIIEGGVPETTALLAEHFDYIFYTGNGNVGRIVMTAAAKHLTPVTLELGGKSPCIVDQNTDLDVAARRILFGKFYNGGQTCVAPDYLLVHETIEDTLLKRMQKSLQDFYGDNPQTSPDYARIINLQHFQRLMNLIPGSGDIFVGGTANETERYIAPTLLRNVPPNSPVMTEEIFGPILPVLKIKNIDEAIAFINARAKPLACYLFSNDIDVQNRVLENTSSGGACVNHATVQIIVPNLPFGGVGASGMGAYHGKKSFETFSHCKSVLVKSTWIDPSIIYPPYTKSKKRWLRWLL